ncbi:MAG: hypothetical protein FWF24_02555 [Alphaproteobacteria bacterium]|nr:hypothetical protein [Alphaproteobacteria bacterium]
MKTYRSPAGGQEMLRSKKKDKTTGLFHRAGALVVGSALATVLAVGTGLGYKLKEDITTAKKQRDAELCLAVNLEGKGCGVSPVYEDKKSLVIGAPSQKVLKGFKLEPK